jgi:hypothetical protein
MDTAWINMWKDYCYYADEKRDTDIMTPKGTFEGWEIAYDLRKCLNASFSKRAIMKQNFENRYGFWKNYY